MSSQERFDELLGLRAEDELDAAAEAELTSLLESNAEWQDEAAADLELSNLFAASREVKAPEGLVASALLAADSKPADQALPRKKSGGKPGKRSARQAPVNDFGC